MNKKPAVIIDTDPGQDDALAIMMLIRSGVADIKAITTVAGNVDIQTTTNNARSILDLAGSNIPIYSGSDKPLKKELVKAAVHGISGLDGIKVNKQEPLNGMAVDKIIEIVRNNPKRVSIIAIGPETNIAKVLLKDPEITQLIKQIVIMGGAIEVPGNKSPVAEFNLFVDPDAAKVVFDSPVTKVLVPLDICNVIPMFLKDFKEIKGKLSKPIVSMMKHFIKGIRIFENFKGALVYDALAVYYLINPKAYEFEKMDIRVETSGDLTTGMSVADRRTWGGKKPNISLVTHIDRKSFVSDFIRIMSD